jgi:hypothetical protein
MHTSRSWARVANESPTTTAPALTRLDGVDAQSPCALLMLRKTQAVAISNRSTFSPSRREQILAMLQLHGMPQVTAIVPPSRLPVVP